MTQSICIISFSVIERDARVLRQIKYLARDYRVTVIGYGPAVSAWQNRPQVTWVSITNTGPAWLTKLKGLLLILARLLPFLYEVWYWSLPRYQAAFAAARTSQAQLYYANDWEALPVAARAAQWHQARLIVDLHEYAPLELENIWHWRLIQGPLVTYFLQRYGPLADASLTVAPAIADRYRQEFALDPLTILNVPEPVPLPAKVRPTNEIRLVHHGNASRERCLERMIETVAVCDRRYSLHFMLINSDPDYLAQLKGLAERLAPGRVTFHQAVPPQEIVARIAQYDIGFYLLEPNSFNNRVALPNKFFDFIVAGLAVCIGPSSSMADFVCRYGLGWTSPSFAPEAVAQLLNQLTTEEIVARQQKAAEAARQFNADREMQKLLDLHRCLLAPEAG